MRQEEEVGNAASYSATPLKCGGLSEDRRLYKFAIRVNDIDCTILVDDRTSKQGLLVVPTVLEYSVNLRHFIPHHLLVAIC
jgi:hypothetical protein